MSESGIQQPSIAILMESDYYEPEISYYQRRFDEVGIRVDFVGRLWGQPSLRSRSPATDLVRRAFAERSSRFRLASCTASRTPAKGT